jgi:hypothetical protein
MVSHEVEERLRLDEVPRTPDRMAVSQRFGLIDEGDVPRMLSGHGSERRCVIRVENDAGVRNSGARDFFNDHTQNGFLLAVTIDEGLKRQVALSLASSFGDFHALLRPKIRAHGVHRVRGGERVCRLKSGPASAGTQATPWQNRIVFVKVTGSHVTIKQKQGELVGNAMRSTQGPRGGPRSGSRGVPLELQQIHEGSTRFEQDPVRLKGNLRQMRNSAQMPGSHMPI